MIAKGVRFNAEKKQVGNYYSTKVFNESCMLIFSDCRTTILSMVIVFLKHVHPQATNFFFALMYLLKILLFFQIWSFTMKSACCKHEIVIQTDPKNTEYVIISGAARKTEEFDIEDAETFALPADEGRF